MHNAGVSNLFLKNFHFRVNELYSFTGRSLWSIYKDLDYLIDWSDFYLHMFCEIAHC